jgi:hypothetical protein
MIALLIVGSVLAYFGFAVFIAIAVHRRTDQILLPLLLLALLLVLPIHELVFGIFEFKKFAAAHPGTAIPRAPLYVDGFLVEGRSAGTPSDAFDIDSIQGRYTFKEFPREAVATMRPAPAAPLDEYVQFFLTSLDDPACTQRLTQDPSSTGCIGVTSSSVAKSRYALLKEPDRRVTAAEQQLNSTKLFPILGDHSRVRDLRTGAPIAEIWSFRMPSKIFRLFSWYSQQNPQGGGDAGFALRPNPIQQQ